jgi:cell division protein FtsL
VVKPSIFSKEYDKKMRRRKRNLIILVIVCIFVIALAVIYIRGAFKDVLKETNKIKSNISAENKPVKDSSKGAKAPVENKSKSTEKAGSYKIELSDGKSANLTYEGKDSEKKFKSVSPGDGSIVYDISPSAKNIVLFDGKSQSILLVDINGSKQDLTNPKYVSTTGNVIEKNTQISNNPSYMWCSSPKFLDDNNIAYTSQLPWLGKTQKYVWIENIQNKSHVMVQGIQGENVKLQGLTEKGLTVVEDGTTVYVNASGSITQ